MRCLPALALVLLGMGLPACAQRGSGHGAAFAGHSAPAAHGSFAPSARPGFGAQFAGQAPRLSSSAPRFGARYPNFASAPSQFSGTRFRGTRQPGYPAGPSGTRPLFYTRSRGGSGAEHTGTGQYGRGRYDRIRPPFARNVYPGYLAYGLGYPFWDDAFDPSWGDYENPGYDTAQGSGEAPMLYPAPPSDDGQPAAYMAAPPQAPQDPWAAAPSSQSPPDEEDAVTLVFKDGRPSEQIHNYALTRTSLYVTGKHIREIPLDQLDLQATERVNRQAGVSFQLP